MAAEEMVLPVVNLDKCDGCGGCVIVCPVQALQVASGKVRIVHTNCNYCGECEAACPTGAISCPFEIVCE